MPLTDQEIARREALQEIIDLGINPFPAEKFEVNFKSTDFTTHDFRKNLLKILEEIKGVDKEKAALILDLLCQNRFAPHWYARSEPHGRMRSTAPLHHLIPA